VHRLLDELRPRSVLDLACSTGWFSRLAAALGSETIAVDHDDGAVDVLIRQSRKERGSILPLVMDINDPSPALGMANRWFPPAVERLKCDLVLALAISHHLVLADVRVDFDEMINGLGSFSSKYLVVEFVPFESSNMTFSNKARAYSEEWYTSELFTRAIERNGWNISARLPSFPEGRQLFVCERPHV